MVHDNYCELEKLAGNTCHCAQRAYEKDPIEGIENPYNDSKDISRMQAYFDEWLGLDL